VDFTFSEDQLLFQDEVKKFLVNEITTEKIRELWDSESGRSDDWWAQLAELGLTGMTVPEDFGGLGMNETDFVLLAQECGFVALPEPLVDTVLVAVPLLTGIGGDLAAQWLPKIAGGEAKVVVGLQQNTLVADANVADLLILQNGNELHALTADAVSLTRNDSVDPSRRLYQVEWTPSPETCIASGGDAEQLIATALDRGALGAAAQSLGLSQRMIELSVQYTADRQQFGVAIGTFQAVKHRMANVAVPLEYAKAVVHRAAASLASTHADASLHVSHAKLAACEAAQTASKNSMQVHGAMGYTWEVDLHIFMKKAWALANTWGDMAFHKNRVEDHVFSGADNIGPGHTFT
jgi:alkylation response protein AidB-like acyl-CoA dehydrogenase